MANRIFYNPDGYVEVDIEGDQTYMSFLNIQSTALEILGDLEAKGKPRIGLIDISKQGKFSPDSNRAAMKVLESLNYDRVAIFGAGKILKDVTQAIILAMGKSKNTKLFSDRASALAWLLEKAETDPPAATT